MSLGKNLQKLREIKREKHHPLIHKIHKKRKISRKTLFYVKEYGPHANVPKTIIRESLKIILLASIISSLGGLALEHIKTNLITLMPLIILLPALNDMIGDYGTIISSRFSTMLHEGKIRKTWWTNQNLKKLVMQLFTISILTAILSSVISIIISGFSASARLSAIIAFKTIFVIMFDVVILMAVIILVSIIAGLYFYRKNEDPNNFLIPITTSIADFSNMIVLSVLVLLFF